MSARKLRWFDSLVHATEDGSWLGGSRYDASPELLHGEMERVAPARACLVAIADFQDNDLVARLASERPNLYVPVAGFNPSSSTDPESVQQEIARIRADGFAGIKLHPRLNSYDPLDERCFAAIQAAGEQGLVVFLDTLFRQHSRPTNHPVDVIDRIAVACRDTKILLLHGGGPHLLELFELVRMHAHLMADLSFTILRYQGSSLDQDIPFVCEGLDQRLTVGSDFPEYTPAQALARFDELTRELPKEKRENVLWKNLAELFPPPTTDSA